MRSIADGLTFTPDVHLHVSIRIETRKLIERKNALDLVSRTELKFGNISEPFYEQVLFLVNNKAASIRNIW